MKISLEFLAHFLQACFFQLATGQQERGDVASFTPDNPRTGLPCQGGGRIVAAETILLALSHHICQNKFDFETKKLVLFSFYKEQEKSLSVFDVEFYSKYSKTLKYDDYCEQFKNARNLFVSNIDEMFKQKVKEVFDL